MRQKEIDTTSIITMIEDQEKRITELIHENSQLKKDGLILESVIQENNKLRKELSERKKSPITDSDWKVKAEEYKTLYRGKAISEGKLKAKISRLQDQLNNQSSHSKPKLCIVRADYQVFSDLEIALNRCENLLKENEYYRKICFALGEEKKSYEVEINELKAKIAKLEEDISDYDTMVSDYDNTIHQQQIELDELKSSNQKLKGKAMSREIMYNSIKEKDACIPVIIEGDEKDLYPGEQKDLILEYLKDKLGNLDPYTRQYHIVKSILEANPEDGNRSSLRKSIFDIFRGFTGTNTMDKDTLYRLNELGFEIAKGKNHDKLIFHGDSRYSISIPTTPKIRRHDNLNQAQDTCKIIL